MGLIFFIKRLVLFAILSIFLYLSGVIIYGQLVPKYFQKNIFYEKFAYGFSNTRYKEVKLTKNVDILFLGSSRSYRHYDPRIFSKNGYSSFNLGSSAQTFLQTEILVKRYLDSLSPQFVVLDIDSGMFSSDGIESSFDLISNDYNNWDTFILSLKLKNIKVINTWIYAIYKEYFFNSLMDKEEEIKGLDKYIAGGYVERELTTRTVMKGIAQNWKFDEKQWQAFVVIIDYLKNSNSKLIVLHSPKQGNFEYYLDDKLRKFFDTNNVHFYNYNKLDFINDSIHFYDASHMNQKGVNLYNNFILKSHFN